MTKKMLLMVLVICTAVLVGCGSEPAPPPTADEPTSEPVQPAPTTEPESEPTEAPESTEAPPEPTEAPAVPMAISSSAFGDGEQIPNIYSCMGDNLSPPLEWVGVPEGTQSLLLLCYDLDAGGESGASTPLGFSHWIVYGIPPGTTGYPEDVAAGETLADGAMQGSNDFAQFAAAGDLFPGGAPIKLVGYDGPCPGGEHRYTFNIYALDALLDLPAAAAMTDVVAAMDGHVLEQAELVGVYTPPQ